MASEVRSRGVTTMPESPVNPYESPSAAEETRSRRPTTPSATGFWVMTVLNALFLVGILATQRVFAARLEARQIELPYLTTVVLGPVFPSIHGVLLLTIIAARRALKAERFNEIWEMILIVLVGAIVGYYVIALWLPHPPRPQPLTCASFCPRSQREEKGTQLFFRSREKSCVPFSYVTITLSMPRISAILAIVPAWCPTPRAK